MPKKTRYYRKKGRKSVIYKYFLKSVNADRGIFRVGDFPLNVWKEVPAKIYDKFKGADGWKGTVKEVDIKGGSK